MSVTSQCVLSSAHGAGRSLAGVDEILTALPAHNRFFTPPIHFRHVRFFAVELYQRLTLRASVVSLKALGVRTEHASRDD